MTKLINRLIKKITLKGAISWLLLFAGIACMTVAFCSTPTAVNVNESINETFMSFTKAEWLYFAYLCVPFLVGSICIWLGVKVNPEPFLKVVRDDVKESPKEEVHNYSTDFEEIYTQLEHKRTIQRVDNLIELIEREDKSNGI